MGGDENRAASDAIFEMQLMLLLVTASYSNACNPHQWKPRAALAQWNAATEETDPLVNDTKPTYSPRLAQWFDWCARASPARDCS